jgi:lipopolysaccharide/colanic/teichoic acid biosynthesis glycosyltransferase
VASIPLPREAAHAESIAWHVVGVTEQVVALALLALPSPVLLVSAAALALLSRRTPVIAHRRMGRNGETLWMLKLRTMWNEDMPRPPASWIEYIDDDAGPERKEAGDPRVTSRFARFCRRHSIDEIPQLWHVIRGQMALIGPRPATAKELRGYYGIHVSEVLQVKPGISGLWQTSGRNRLSYAERCALDLEFVRRRSFAMYLRIALRTITEMWSGANSW